MPAIEVRHLAKTYRVTQKASPGVWSTARALFHRKFKQIQAVDDISFSIDEGEMVAFLGPNGAGKTTTLKMLSGLIYPTRGDALVLGFIPWERSNAYRRRFALVMGQKNQLWWDLPAEESFRLHREIYEIPEDQFNRVRKGLIDLLGLEKLVGQPVRELSLGERMKMELIAALLHSPKVLFLDEPTIGLDVVAQTQLRAFLREYIRRERVTVLLTSHYMKDVESLCDRAIIIHGGKILFDGALARILAQFSHHKLVRLQFEELAPPDLERYGEIVEIRGPMARIRVPRQSVADALADVLHKHRLVDVTVDEIPLEEVIADVFRQSDATAREQAPAAEVS